LFAAATNFNRFVVNDAYYTVISLVLLLDEITPLADWSRVSVDLFFQFISLSHYTVPLLQRQHHYTKKLILNKMLSILVDNAAANEQLTVNISSNFPQYC